MSRILVERDVLLAPLAVVSGAVEHRHTLPILANALLEIDDGRLTVTTSDGAALQISMVADAPSNGHAQATTVSARKLQDILRQVDAGPVELDVQELRLKILSAGAKFSLQALPATEFPKAALGAEAATAISLPQRALKQLLAQTQVAMAGVKETRYYLVGALFSVRDDGLTVVTADGFRLAQARYAVALDAPPVDIITPRKCIVELARLLADTDEPVRLRVVQKRAESALVRSV